MKLKPSHSVISLFLGGLLGFAVPSNAQENRTYNEPDVILKETRIDPIPTSETESRTIVTKSALRDSIQQAPKLPGKTTKPGEKSTKEKSEDPLSFNFLYYIIEKFKMSDMID